LILVFSGHGVNLTWLSNFAAMYWKQFLTSGVGKKFVMGFTGLFLVVFLIIHCGINCCIFVPDQGKTFLTVAHFMGFNWIMHILELGLFAGILLHIIQGIMLTIQNSRRRPVRYKVSHRNQNSTWYSRSMGLLGTLILIFLVVHLSEFWGPNRYHMIIHGKELNLFLRMKREFSHGWVVIVYLAGLFSLFWHLLHGFHSAFRTFGLDSKKYIPLVKALGTAYSILIPVIFALMPLSFYFKLVQ